MLVERRKRAADLGGESAFATRGRGCARAVGGYFERDLVHPACSRACSPSEASCRQGFGVMFTVFTALRSSFDPRRRHPVKTADAEWCQPVFVLNLPNSCSTCERADGQAERLLLAWTGLRCRHGRATEGVACGRPRVRSRPWRRLNPRPDGEDRERRRSQLVFDGRRVLSCTRERDRQD